MAIYGPLVDAIQWHEGMLLLPQHFQQSDLHRQQILHFHLEQSLAFHWGVSHYKIDPVMLVSGSLKFLELEAIMPDGLVVSQHALGGDTLELDLIPFIEELSDHPMTVYLTVPEYKYGAANLSGDLPRYKSIEGKSVVDDNTGEGEVSFPRIRPNIKLIIANEPPRNYISFPILKIEHRSNSYMLTEFIPPMLKVTMKSKLGEMCLELAKRVRKKIAFLTERLYSSTTGVLSSESEDAVKFLSSALLPFEAALHGGGSSPYGLYISLCSLAGQSSALQPGQMPPLFAPYDHNNLYSSYREVIDFIIDMVERIREGYFLVPFKLKDRMFNLKIKSEWLGKKLVVAARYPKEMSETELVNWIHQSVIASESIVTKVRDKRIRGAQRKIIEGDEEMNLYPAKGVILFSIEVDPGQILSGETLQIFNIEDTREKRPLELVLYVPKKRR